MRIFFFSLALAVLLTGTVAASWADAQWRRGRVYYYPYPARTYYYSPPRVYFSYTPGYYHGGYYYARPYRAWRWR
ncbi:MAG: hypothetical protein HYX68_21285 [Planctomycetes bacterium]|jgi:hypothetical protein|nr:hypothetical protein [Planctomycetota bacterium]